MVEGPEECEEGMLERLTCEDLGYEQGSPYCGASCQIAGCYTCGNGMCENSDGESVFNCPADCGGWLDLTAGGAHTCAVTQSGNVWCWGSNAFGQLGRGAGRGTEGLESSDPARVTGLSSAVAVSAGLNHTCALRDDGTVYCWGSDLMCQLGLGGTTGRASGDTQLRAAPTRVPGLHGAIGVSAGGDHSCAVLLDGSVWCWGRNAMGQLGDASGEERCQPARVVDLPAAVRVVAGRSTTCAETSGGALWCWGANDVGQLGIGARSGPQLRDGLAYSDRPVRVAVLSETQHVSLGVAHACALRIQDLAEHSVSEVWCWGLGGEGQLGDGSAHEPCAGLECSPSPVRTALSWQASAVSAGGRHSCAMLYDGHAYCWGANEHGQLGAAGAAGCGAEECATPVRVSTLTSVRLLAAGDAHACAVTADKTLWCWGSNEHGQLSGQGGDRSEPQVVFDSIVR